MTLRDSLLQFPDHKLFQVEHENIGGKKWVCRDDLLSANMIPNIRPIFDCEVLQMAPSTKYLDELIEKK